MLIPARLPARRGRESGDSRYTNKRRRSGWPLLRRGAGGLAPVKGYGVGPRLLRPGDYDVRPVAVAVGITVERGVVGPAALGHVTDREADTKHGAADVVLDDLARAIGGRRAPVSYTHLRAHETVLDLVCRLLLEKKKAKKKKKTLDP